MYGGYAHPHEDDPPWRPGQTRQDRAVAVFGRREGIPVTMRVDDGFRWYLRERRGLDAQRASAVYGRLLHQIIPDTVEGIYAQIETAIKETS